MNNGGKQVRTPSKQKVMTLEQAKQAILELVDSGVHYREIAQIEWNIEGRKKHFGISEISGFVKEREEKEKPQSRDAGDLDAELFKLFDAGKSSTYAVTKLHVTAEVADAKYKKWFSMKENDLSHLSVPRRLKQLEDWRDNLDFIEEILKQIKDPFTEKELQTARLPDWTDLWRFLRNAKLYDTLPILNFAKRFCTKCGTKEGLTPFLSYECKNCHEESDWWRI